MFDRLAGAKENRNHQQTGHRGSKATEKRATKPCKLFCALMFKPACNKSDCCVNTSLVCLKFRDHNTFLGNYSPTPPLNQHFALREKQERKVSVGVGLGEG